ncbi:MAG TPA: helix-turn-helix transcriptional regulator, partial [Ktedonobacteraceae bacterium]|nr:helix-turn-helix transcriptional regulator [Ktedonobacteraceae bacterium]
MNQQEAAISSRVAGQTVGQFIRGQRLKLGLTQEALAEAIGASTRSIRRWELDQAIPHEVVRNRLCTVFGIEKDSLLGAWSIEQVSLPSLPFWHVPLPRNPFFTGREELLHALHARLKSEQRMALTQSWAISGLGGIGKTQSALEYVYQHAQDYSAVFWISAATQESLQAGLVTVAECLGLPEKDGRDHQRIIGAVKQWLATHQDWLLILDNADDVTLVQNVLPTQRSGCVLLTTRAQALGPFAQRIDVETMGMAEGTLFLLRRARLLTPDASLDCASLDYLTAAEAIVIEMDFLPLALDQAGAYIEEVGCSLVSYLDLYRTHRAELLSRRGQMPGDYPDSVATTWSLNFQQVEQANSVATQLLRLCAFLSPDAIPEELLSEGSAVLEPVLGQIAINTLALNGAMEQLRKFSLVQRDPEAQLLRLHRLVQVVLKDAMSREEQGHWAERAIRMTKKVFPDIDDKDAWSRDRRLLSQAQACSVLIQEYALVFEEAAVLLQRTADYLFHSVLYEQAEHLYQQALHIWEKIGTQHPEAARSFSGLASIYQMQRKYEQAEALYQRALCIREQTQGPEHPEVAGPLRDLGFLSTR